jgi:glycosyltransferase involved in cell wall biosynthesis
MELNNNNYIIIPYSIYGGGEVYIKNHIEAGTLKNVHLVFINKNNELYKLMHRVVPTHVLGDIQNLGKFLEKNKVINVTFYNSASVARSLMSYKSKLGLLITEIVHSTMKWSDSMHGINRSFVDNYYVVASKVASDWGIKNYNILPPKIKEDKFKLPKIKNDRFVVGTVARFSPEKNLKKIVDVASFLDDRFLFVIVGKDGGSRKEIEAYIKLKNLSNRFEIKDYREDIENEYARFDCFLLTSRVEGTPITILEAKAAGLPVIAPDVGAIKEMLDEKKDIIFEANENPEYIAKFLAFHLKNENN